jgi:hypothetical protein
MLNEHYSHSTERRGAGFTQATRHLAAFVNNRRSPNECDELRLFLRPPSEHLAAVKRSRARCGLAATLPPEFVADEAAQSDYRQELEFRRALLSVQTQLEFEESHLIASIVLDLLLSDGRNDGLVELPVWHSDLQIGTCPLAEKYFLELADAFVRRSGRVNILVSSTGEPLVLEKLNLGDNHSCVSVAPLVFNGVRLPPGSLLGVHYETEPASRANRTLPGNVIPIEACSGFRFLRLTTLSVSPQNRQRAFTTHFQTQIAAGLFAPGTATVAQLRSLAESQL